MRISDWSSDVCSSDLRIRLGFQADGCRSGGVYRRTGVWDARCDGVNCAVLDIQSCRGRAGQGDGDGLPVTRTRLNVDGSRGAIGQFDAVERRIACNIVDLFEQLGGFELD